MSGPFGESRIRGQVDGTTSVAALYQKNYFNIEIPLPPLQEQRAIVAEIREEQALIDANRVLVATFERKIENAVAAIWST